MPQTDTTELLRQALKAGGMLSDVVSSQTCVCSEDRQCVTCVSYSAWQRVSDEIEDTLLDIEHSLEGSEEDRAWSAVEDMRSALEAMMNKESGGLERDATDSEMVFKLESIRTNLLCAVERLGEANTKLSSERDRWYQIAEMYYLCREGAEGAFQRELGEKN
jgi:hypothetical protein